MFMKHTLQDDLRDKRVREKATIDRKHKDIASLEEDETQQKEEAIR